MLKKEENFDSITINEGLDFTAFMNNNNKNDNENLNYNIETYHNQSISKPFGDSEDALSTIRDGEYTKKKPKDMELNN